MTIFIPIFYSKYWSIIQLIIGNTPIQPIIQPLMIDTILNNNWLNNGPIFFSNKIGLDFVLCEQTFYGTGEWKYCSSSHLLCFKFCHVNILLPDNVWIAGVWSQTYLIKYSCVEIKHSVTRFHEVKFLQLKMTSWVPLPTGNNMHRNPFVVKMHVR